ncbi:MAG: quinolinate synthase NadA [Fidelibacterota bacterium]
MEVSELVKKDANLSFSRFRSLDEEELFRIISRAKDSLNKELLILGHHYQQDEIIQFAHERGDSFKLAQFAASNKEKRYIIFCGVHFMAESADILTSDDQIVVLPDLSAGCSMADMADLWQVEEAWDELSEICSDNAVMPVTYMNSTADLKAFCGERGGIVCTSSNASAVLEWSFNQKEKVLFFPDQHLGRNTAKNMGIPLDQMIVWDPGKELGGNGPDAIKRAKMILWNGYCSVHQIFTAAHVKYFREKYPGINIITHPECKMEVVDLSDYCGSTEYIKKTISSAPSGTIWAIGTELNLVNRLKKENPDKHIYFLSPTVCFCSTMYRIDLPHLAWAIENLASGIVINQIKVPLDVQHWAKVALERMLQVRGTGKL